jgi:hypothetical protein
LNQPRSGGNLDLFLIPNIPYVSKVLTNLLTLLEQLGEAGLIGLIALIIIPGQIFLFYRLYIFFKARAI